MRASHLCLLALAAGCSGPQLARGGSPTRGARPTPDLEALLSRMTLAEKIGQMTQPDHGTLKKSPSDVRELFIGSVLNGGDNVPEPNSPEGWADVYDRYQAHALETRLGIPMIYGVDAVHGHNGMKGAVIFPHNIGLGATRNPALVEQAARITAAEVAATGIDWTFSPCIAVSRDERWGRTYESFGETPELAESLGPAAVRGYQGELGGPTSVLACAKHFIGDGGTSGGKDQGDTVTSDEELRRLHLPGYRAAIAAGAGSIMISFSSVRGQTMHGHRQLITDVLKGELGFTGFTISDYNGIDKIPGDYRTQVETAVNAGVDMFMEPERYRSFIATLTQLVKDGRVPMARIDDAVRRILRQKAALKLWERPFADRALAAKVGSSEHRGVARQLVSESLVLLKNARGALPIARATTAIHVGGKRADDLGAQCGGWAIGWQGRNGPITTGTTILEGIRQAVPGARVTFSADGPPADDAQVLIAVVGEDPYAEGKGDREDLTLGDRDLALVTSLRRAARGRPVIVILISGRPMVLGPVLTQADAIVAAWLPGTEGAGIADVLFGHLPPKGKLGFSWPRSMDQVPINHGDAKYDPLFPYGFGLTY